ncbi:sulfur oxidation c-type cytochrome SoxX [Bradyrhizobium sp. HKCCYLS2038]|uniref:sulfur oxidation c-type cytochrome SoxX n=1 Tax=unclassified Bradyrhizobium TaxID=2631580 RepID=UPI003EBAC27B
MRHLAFSLFVLSTITTSSVWAEDLTAIRVDKDSIAQPLTSQPGNPKNGAAAMADRKLGNCLACHKVAQMKSEPFHGDVGPALDGVAGRWKEGQLRLIVVNPKVLFEDTAMPAFYRTAGMHRVRGEFQEKPMLTAQQVEDVVAYLTTLRD